MWKGNALLTFLAIIAFSYLEYALGGNAFVAWLRNIAIVGLVVSLVWGLVSYLARWVPVDIA